MSLTEIAAQTLHFLDTGYVTSPTGERLALEPALTEAIQATRLYTPLQVAQLLAGLGVATGNDAKVEVTEETTQAAARRLVEAESIRDLVLLNFASARHPGGGFLNGAKAQEESLARSSGLYRCLLTQPAYYEANRSSHSALYTDHIIYSPRVPWFRTQNDNVADTVVLASVISAPAPNAGAERKRNRRSGDRIDATLRRRAGCILAVAAHEGHRNLLLGAWGCGVFRNDPGQVADAFGQWLESARFVGLFDRVVFAIHDSTPSQSTLAAFRRRFPSST